MSSWVEDALDSFEFIAEDQNRDDLKEVVARMRVKYSNKHISEQSKAWKDNNTLLKLKESLSKETEENL